MKAASGLSRPVSSATYVSSVVVTTQSCAPTSPSATEHVGPSTTTVHSGVADPRKRKWRHARKPTLFSGSSLDRRERRIPAADDASTRSGTGGGSATEKKGGTKAGVATARVSAG